MKSTIFVRFAFCLLFLSVGFLASCGGSGGNGLLGGAALGLGDEDGLELLSDPTEVILDLTDPDTPVDPDTGKAFMEVALLATAVDELGAPQQGLAITFTSTAGVLASGSNPVLTDEEGHAADVLLVVEDDPDSIDVTATDGTRTETITLAKTVIVNQPPVSDAGIDLVVECTSDAGTPGTLDGSGSSDPDSTEGTNDDIVLFEWFADFETPDEIKLGEGMMLEVSLELGAHTITLRVTDSEGLTDTDDVTVTISDTIPPTLSFEVSPSYLWPPDHTMREIHAMATAEDACSDVSVTLVSVTSSEPDNGLGDGDTSNDIQGVDEGADFDFLLRSERAGPEPGRIYTIRYNASDTSGNDVDASGEVLVPHDMG